MGEFAAALAFLTRLPVGRRFTFDTKQVARSARFFPLVGALLGAVAIGVLWLASRVFPPLMTAVLLVGLEALLTGALHFDGLADTADGFGGGATRDDVLRIMRDHAIGSFGGVALALVIVFKIAAISTLIGMDRAIGALLVAPVLGRWLAVLLSGTQPYARADGASPAALIGRTEVIIATVLAAAIAVLADPWRGSVAVVWVALVTAGWGWCCRRRIGGVTGDTVGAGIEISECLVLGLWVALRNWSYS